MYEPIPERRAQIYIRNCEKVYDDALISVFRKPLSKPGDRLMSLDKENRIFWPETPYTEAAGDGRIRYWMLEEKLRHEGRIIFDKMDSETERGGG